MALNFRIFIHKSSAGLKLKLMGDFDGSSAFELVNVLKDHCGKVGQVVINTGGLSSIHPFGLGVFQKQCVVNKISGGVKFTGKYGDTISPQASNSL